MIVYLSVTDENDEHLYEVNVDGIPRIGEQVLYQEHIYLVKNVRYDIDDNDILIVLEIIS